MSAEEKAALRAEIRARIAALSWEYISLSDVGIMQNVLALPEFAAAGRAERAAYRAPLSLALRLDSSPAEGGAKAGRTLCAPTAIPGRCTRRGRRPRRPASRPTQMDRSRL